jgi:hypothetical protein
MARKAAALTFLILVLSGLDRCFSQTVQGAGFDPAAIQIPAVQKSSDRAVTSWDLIALRDVHGLAISPDGKHVAVVIGQAVYETNSYRTSLLVVSTKPGSAPLNLGTAGVPHWDVINQWPAEAPQWSPDSRYITIGLEWRWERRCRSGGGPSETNLPFN